jgi:hypothetical protein
MKAITNCMFEISENSFDSLPMRVFRLMHEFAYTVDGENNVWMSETQIV